MQNYGGTLTWFQKNDAEMLSEEISEGNEILSMEDKEDAVEFGVSGIDTANPETKAIETETEMEIGTIITVNEAAETESGKGVIGYWNHGEDFCPFCVGIKN